jgi:predicted TIM-barrel fold metal-dependent hydrolase
MSTSLNRIDVHHHIFPPAYLKAAADAGVADAGGFKFPQSSPELSLALMDRHGIATAITCVGSPGVHFGNHAAARDLARYCNEYAARFTMDHPNRLGSFAVLPLPDVDGALKEIEYAMDTLKLDGVNLLTNFNGAYLGDPAFDAVFDELNRRKATVFVHPETAPAARDIKLSFPGAMIEFTFDTTRMAANLIFSGTLERCPDVKIILAHSGGTIPYLAWRISLFDVMPNARENAPQGTLAYLKRLYYETAIASNSYALNSLTELVPSSQILYGSDFPYLPEPLIGAVVQGIDHYPGFDAQVRAAIERDNALTLFPRLQSNVAEVR